MNENYTPPESVTPPEVVVADPKKPYKAYVAFVLTTLGLFWAALQGRDTLDNMSMMEWLSIIIPVILTTGAVYGVENPKVVETPNRRQ